MHVRTFLDRMSRSPSLGRERGSRMACTHLADARIADEEELEEVVVLAGVHVEGVGGVEGRCLGGEGGHWRW